MTRPEKISGFPPVADRDARALVLGTMPGAASLAAAQYYAHPRNHFWRIMSELAGAAPHMPYARRLALLKANNIALWDVLRCCVRPGSLDSSISQEAANDFISFFADHPKIRHVFFNGAPAAKFFKKFVVDDIRHLDLQFTTLPSTSPANAGWCYEQKLEKWREILEPPL